MHVYTLRAEAMSSWFMLSGIVSFFMQVETWNSLRDVKPLVTLTPIVDLEAVQNTVKSSSFILGKFNR